MFYRGTKFSQGSGLGMYIVKETLEKLNGTITLNSKINVGSTFAVSIPNLIENR
jgi:signal transduction histidine kinase